MNKYNVRPNGLGVIITQLSFILAMKKPVTAVVSNSNNLVYDLKRIFDIPDSVLTIESGTHGWPDLETDELCTYAPYFHSDYINLFGQKFSTSVKKKPCVAMAMHHDGGLGDELPVQGMPYNKFATAEQYNQTFCQLTAWGYDVITMNQSRVNIEQKIYMLNELCDFVIGYEGGLQHMAHVLKIPCIVFPWKYNDMGGQPKYPGMYYETHRFHPDRRTWFLNTVDEFLSWSKHDLTRMLSQLHDLGGNNVLFEPGTIIDVDTLQITTQNGRSLTPRIMWCETRGKYTTEFIKAHLPMENMVKYPLKSTIYNS